MKNSAIPIANQIVQDSKEYIDGNIAEYMIQAVDEDDSNFFQYLTHEEIEEVNGNKEKWKELGEEVCKMLRDNFDFDISESNL